MDQIIALSSSEEYEEEKQDEIIDNTNITEEESKQKFLAPYVKAPDYSEYNKCNLTNRPDCINLIREVKKTKDLDSSGFMKWLLMRTVPNNHTKILANADRIQQFTEKRQLARWIKEKYLGKDADSIFKQGASISAHINQVECFESTEDHLPLFAKRCFNINFTKLEKHISNALNGNKPGAIYCV
ncbi:hypothetical protein BRETT_004720 [Brettanomyces bruxellensis]|uniref:Uncharacterized protein n=1 Tax=Dekkera bruxellensis TaxID=5007 RepID=A0A871RAG2_DEKBR|nr:uncharacterized protein BRETT_004720 [Brettanomyces bruxellensis]QOU20072.1 hypothetical protein BRETT_004720 [Brettanomyces bruxellensis]